MLREQNVLLAWMWISQREGMRMRELTLPLASFSIGQVNQDSFGEFSLVVWVLES